MKTHLFLLLAAATLLITGCASPISKAKSAGINTVHIKPRVSSNDMLFNKVHGGNLTIALSAKVLDSIMQDDMARMRYIMDKNEIDLPQMVRTQFVEVLEQNSDLVIKERPADGTLMLNIVQHGFEEAGITINKRAPYVLLQAELFDRQGKRVWRVGAFSDRPIGMGETWDDYDANPELLRRHWEILIDSAVRKLLRTK